MQVTLSSNHITSQDRSWSCAKILLFQPEIPYICMDRECFLALIILRMSKVQEWLRFRVLSTFDRPLDQIFSSFN